ncbi:stemmadenine O-acetyltransferase [Ziziphus jujuba]|uniref:Stemmadenine O-acetyltransferase n=1 Tax=Ziziphus jujuba TaxID=326968 RepID=A0A6P4AYM6_ZIZJJ|nr:stemmadenine O-acetyltransferase [Ziziphus jujuba]
MELKVDIIAKQRIKPSSPTPTHLKNFNLSLLDQIHPPIYGLIILFYSADTKIEDADIGDHHQCRPNSLERNNSQHLKNSLAETLTSFYPMAGKLKDAISVDCNDEGALFVEANVNCSLSEFLTKPDAKLLNHFLPTNDPTTRDFAPGCMGIIQFTRFQCGGTAISVCLSHKLFDVSSLITFLHGWTSNMRGYSQTASPVFIGDSLLPPRDLSSFMPRPNYMLPPGKLTTKRFVFEAAKIAGLKANVGSIRKQYPSRVEIVMALILKGAMSASRSITGSVKPSVLFQAVDLRRRMNKPLPKNSIGNLFWLAPVVIKDEMDLKTMVYKMKEAVNEFSLKASKFNGEEGFSVISEFFKGREDYKDMERYSCTSWCKFPLYETDFGFGKPVWVSSTSVAFKNTIVLVDTKQGDGIEAWVTLEEENMLIFEGNYQGLLDSA